MKKPASFKITTADEEDLSDDENIDDVVVKGGGGSAVDPVLFIMKDLRKKMAKHNNVPHTEYFKTLWRLWLQSTR